MSDEDDILLSSEEGKKRFLMPLSEGLNKKISEDAEAHKRIQSLRKKANRDIEFRR